MAIFWMKLLFGLGKIKDFLFKHWKITLVVLGFLAVVVYFEIKLRKQEDHISTLNQQTERYVRQMQSTTRVIASIEQIQRDTAQRQNELVAEYHRDIETLTNQYNKDIEALRSHSEPVRAREAARFTQEPSDGTRSLSERFGIPIGD